MLQVWYIFCSLVKDLDWLHLMCSILYSMDISATTWYLLYLLLAKTVGTNITAWDPAETYPGFGSTGEGEVQQKGFQKKRSFVVTHITRCFTKEKCRLLSTGTKCNSFKRSWQWEVTHVLMSGNIKNEPQTFLSFKTPAGGTLLHKLLVSELFFSLCTPLPFFYRIFHLKPLPVFEGLSHGSCCPLWTCTPVCFLAHLKYERHISHISLNYMSSFNHSYSDYMRYHEQCTYPLVSNIHTMHT